MDEPKIVLFGEIQGAELKVQSGVTFQNKFDVIFNGHVIVGKIYDKTTISETTVCVYLCVCVCNMCVSRTQIQGLAHAK